MVLVIADVDNASSEVLSAIETIKKRGADVIEEDDVLDAFCKNEAVYRLNEFFGIEKKDQTEEMVCDVQDIIRDVIDNYEGLYDKIDSEISNYLENESHDGKWYGRE